jgi:predicted ATP-dependent endonuclease of OLD family
LISFTAKNFRSITDAYKLPLRDVAILVGPNNEGKSNILRGIVTALTLITRSKSYTTRRYAVHYHYVSAEEFDYRWVRDFPVSLQESEHDGKSDFILEFGLDPKELAAFNKVTSSNLASNLKLRLLLGKESAALDVLLQGKGKKHLVQRLPQIAEFVAERIDIQYIPALRPSDLATNVVDYLLSRELSALEAHQSYRALLKQLEDAQKPVLDALAAELTETVGSFIPEVKRISIRSSELRQAIRRSSTVLVDDGTNTSLAMKGDGVKSLTAISLLRHLSQRALGDKSLILAIEEPESHLHPRAIHRLREVILEIASSHQVLITTHCPVLVNRAEPPCNIIVQHGRAVAARRLKDIRDALGVELSDNLASAYLVLLVEGEEDARVLRAWLPSLSEKLKNALSSGTLAIDTLAGATNLRYKVGIYKNLLCNVHALVDNDEAGRLGVQAALDLRLLDLKEITQTVCQGMTNSEFEDLLDEAVYSIAVRTAFGVVLAPKCMNTNKKQWSDRIRDCFQDQGKAWTRALERQVKDLVSNTAATAGLASLNQHRRGPIDALVATLEQRLA